MSLCPKLDHLVGIAFSHAQSLLANRDPVFPFLVTSSPGSAFGVREYRQSKGVFEAVQDVLTADATIDCCVLGYHLADKEIHGRLRQAIVAIPSERGADKTHEYVQELRPASLWRRVELVKAAQRGEQCASLFRPVPVPESYWHSSDRSDIPGLLIALKIPSSSAWAAERLAALGPDALEPLARIARDDRCTLLQACARDMDRLIRIRHGDTNAPHDSTLADRASGDHREAGGLLSGIWDLRRQITREENDLAARREQEERAKTAEAAFQTDTELHEYWEKLEHVGWLDDVPARARRQLMLSIVRARAADAANLHYGLSAADLSDKDDEELSFSDEGTGANCPMGKILARYSRASYAQFQGEDPSVRFCVDEGAEAESAIARVGFSVKGSRIRFAARFQESPARAHDEINRGLAKAGEAARFFLLPASDDRLRLVYVTPEVYARAEDVGILPAVRPVPGDAFRRVTRVYIPRARDVRIAVAGNDALFVTDWARTITRLDPVSLIPVWTVKADYFAPSWVRADILFCHRWYGHVGHPKTRAVQISTGQTLWELPGEVLKAEWRGLVPLHESSSTLTFVDPHTGEQKHQIPTPDMAAVLPFWNDGVLLRSYTETPALHLVDIRSGQVVWERALDIELQTFGGDARPRPLLIDHVSAERFVLYQYQGEGLSGATIDPGDGEITGTWHLSLPGMSFHMPILREGVLYWLHDDRLVAVDHRSGAIVFDVIEPALDRMFNAIGGTVYGDCLAYSVQHAGLCLFDSRDGRLRARIPEVLGMPVASDQRLLVADDRFIDVFAWT